MEREDAEDLAYDRDDPKNPEWVERIIGGADDAR